MSGTGYLSGGGIGSSMYDSKVDCNEGEVPSGATGRAPLSLNVCITPRDIIRTSNITSMDENQDYYKKKTPWSTEDRPET